jgi:hypothetical protein
VTTTHTNGTHATPPLYEPGVKRTALHCYTSTGAHNTWHGFAAANGMSLSALIQALADLGTFAVFDTGDPEAAVLANTTVAEHFARVVGRGRAIDAARRRRTRR